MTAPRYQDITGSAIPEVTDDDGTRVRVIIGDFWGKRGPVEGIAADPRYLDVWVPPGKRKTLAVEVGRQAEAFSTRRCPPAIRPAGCTASSSGPTCRRRSR